jgi:hypothetical protein
MKKQIQQDTLIRLQMEYNRFYAMAYKPEEAIQQALKSVGLPSDFKREDYELSDPKPSFLR